MMSYREKLIDDLVKLFADFADETGLYVDRINVEHVEVGLAGSVGGKKDITRINLEIS